MTEELDSESAVYGRRMNGEKWQRVKKATDADSIARSVPSIQHDSADWQN